MPNLRTVEFWPATGFVGRPWLEDPAEDAWVKSARRVCELYSAALADHELVAHVSSLRMFVHAEDGPAGRSTPTVVVTPHLDPVREGFESAVVTVPPEVVDLTPLARAQLVLAAVTLVMRSLAGARGWLAEAVGALDQAVRDRGLHFDWTGRAVQDRRRRYRARTVFGLGDDGFGRVRVELHDARTEQLVGLSRELMASSTIEGFRRTSTSLRWRDATTVSLEAFSDAFGLFTTEVVLEVGADFTSPPPVGARFRHPRRQGPPAHAGVELAGPPVPAITGGGGGPMNDVPPLYAAAVQWLFDHVPDEVTAWWRQTGLTTLNVTYDYWGDRVAFRLRRTGNDLEASVRRPMPDATAEADPIRTAQLDLTNVLQAVQRRFRLSSPPVLPVPPEGELADYSRSWSEDLDEDTVDLDLMRSLLSPELFAVLEAQQAEDDD